VPISNIPLITTNSLELNEKISKNKFISAKIIFNFTDLCNLILKKDYYDIIQYIIEPEI
jgi:hypothetical protein